MYVWRLCSTTAPLVMKTWEQSRAEVEAEKASNVPNVIERERGSPPQHSVASSPATSSLTRQKEKEKEKEAKDREKEDVSQSTASLVVR